MHRAAVHDVAGRIDALVRGDRVRYQRAYHWPRSRSNS